MGGRFWRQIDPDLHCTFCQLTLEQVHGLVNRWWQITALLLHLREVEAKIGVLETIFLIRSTR